MSCVDTILCDEAVYTSGDFVCLKLLVVRKYCSSTELQMKVPKRVNISGTEHAWHVAVRKALMSLLRNTYP